MANYICQRIKQISKDMRKFIVYKHTNVNNGKAYIGITSTSVKKRWNCGHGYDMQPKFRRAIEKYGANSFTHEVLADNLTKAEACVMEKLFIRQYDTINNGYNVSVGGVDMDCASERLAVDKYDPETGELICSYKSIMDAAFDVKTSDAHISEACRGLHKVIAGFGWAYHGEPWEKPTSYAHYRNEIEKADKETGEIVAVYKSLKEASDASGISKAMISLCCNGKCETGGGFKWRYI